VKYVVQLDNICTGTYHIAMKRTSVFLLRDNLSSYLDEVQKTEVPLVICKYRKPIAIIMPAKKEKLEPNLNRFCGFLADRSGKSGVQIENARRRNVRERTYVKKLLKKHG